MEEEAVEENLSNTLIVSTCPHKWEYVETYELDGKINRMFIDDCGTRLTFVFEGEILAFTFIITQLTDEPIESVLMVDNEEKTKTMLTADEYGEYVGRHIFNVREVDADEEPNLDKNEVYRI